MERHGIGDGKTALHGVVSVEAHVARIGRRCLEAPITGGGKLDASRRTQCLGNRPIVFLHAPRSQVLRKNSEAKPLGDFAFDARVGGGEINLASNRKKLFIASSPASDKSRLAPWPPDAEVDRSRQGARTQVAFSKRSSLANAISINRNHVEERTRRQIHKLSKQVLIHFHRLERISADRFLNTSVEVQYVVAQMKGRVQPDVKGVVGGIAVDDLVCARQRNLTACVAHLKESTDVRKGAEVQVISTRPLRLNRGTWQRKQSLTAWYGIGDIQLGIQR